MTPAGVITASGYISVVSMQFERYHALNRVRGCLLDCRRNVRSVITTKTSQSPLPSRMTPAGAVGGTRGCHRSFWSARGECWQPPMYFDMSNNPAIDVAKCSCVAMPAATLSGQIQREINIIRKFAQTGHLCSKYEPGGPKKWSDDKNTPDFDRNGLDLQAAQFLGRSVKNS